MNSTKAGTSCRAGTYRSLGTWVVALCLIPMVVGCGGGGESGEGGEAGTSSQASASAGSDAASDLTPWQVENGIGPITEPLQLGEIDPALVAQGEEIFTLKCSACHKLDERYVAPPLREVTSRRTPEFVVNMMLNPLEMTQKHPVTKELLGEYFTPMTPQGLTEEDARSLLDYLRQALIDGPSGD